MPRSFTASDRQNLVRLSSTLPVGSSLRKAILAGLKVAGGGKPNPSHKFDLFVVGENVKPLRGVSLSVVTAKLKAAQQLENIDPESPRYEALLQKSFPLGVSDGVVIRSNTDGTSWDWQGEWVEVTGDNDYAHILKSASGNAKQIAKDILTFFEQDNGFPSGHFSPKTHATLERALAKMIADGAVFDEDAIEVIAAGETDDREDSFGEFKGYRELDKILDGLLDGE